AHVLLPLPSRASSVRPAPPAYSCRLQRSGGPRQLPYRSAGPMFARLAGLSWGSHMSAGRNGGGNDDAAAAGTGNDGGCNCGGNGDCGGDDGGGNDDDCGGTIAADGLRRWNGVKRIETPPSKWEKVYIDAIRTLHLSTCE
ncbi:unnamed protein product, partial [Phaeothamnion confervicola]